MGSKTGKQPSKPASPAIPIIAGLMVMVIVVGAILSTEHRQPAAASFPGGASIPVDTARPLPTRAIPYPDVLRIPPQDAWDKLEQGTVVLIDVRSRASYDKMHAAGAISVPEDEIGAVLDELPRDKDWILYCT